MQSFSVTTVLGVYSNFDMVKPDTLAAAIERGNVVHRAAAAYARGLYVPPMAMDHQKRFESFKIWFDTYVDRVIFVEERFFNETFYFDGKPDFGLILIDGRRVITDIKTAAAEQKTWKSQVAAYCELARKKYPPGFQGMSLRVKADGSAAIGTPYEYTADDFAAFLAALTAYRYFKS